MNLKSALGEAIAYIDNLNSDFIYWEIRDLASHHGEAMEYFPERMSREAAGLLATALTSYYPRWLWSNCPDLPRFEKALEETNEYSSLADIREIFNKLNNSY